MSSNILLLLGSAFLLSYAILFILLNERRDIVLERLRLKRRRDSGSRTPPRSFSPQKRKTQNVSELNYSTTYPPSRRSTLIGADIPSTPTEAVAASRPDWTKRIIPTEASYLEAADDMYTPCEFSIEEIKALGAFPDYASLSGVPLPKPYDDFDIKKALPRPYRPFRWAYHQTMCKCIRFFRGARIKYTYSSYEDGAGLVARTREHIRKTNEAAISTPF